MSIDLPVVPLHSMPAPQQVTITSFGWFGSIWFTSGIANHDVGADSSLVQLLFIPTTLQMQGVKTGGNPTQIY